MINDISAIILAAGYSSRMGVPKLSLKFDDNSSFLEKAVIEYFKFGCSEIIVVVNEQGKELFPESSVLKSKNVKIVVNEQPGLGRFYSLKKACKALKEMLPCFVHNVDNPFVTQNVLQALRQNRRDYDYVMPVYDRRGGHPFFISEKIVLAISKEKDNDLHMKDYLSKYSSKRIETEDKNILLNINNLEDYKRYFN